ncbi:hypothetical protein COU17_00530 [Candidatus Kaiserbacteria bacterium CG10_big_fil_rev_8_21_14_0_10_49_17]|uniref:OmpR/PhoB-type domain-containing protein n=1 Tax=Candidatus Kaiserbacteria bacterium CG10_big_fil_rev_8_21_14_0_10_49_17 TaxID=1974609 RepID=A0A2M6WF91_9BACT|nr:MAG: hypothetical protein COU17_00530 [Candidatus Kaiserbacteria bacterium CG10_big_fil_rev_8_21_14_0_10_49_17]
MSMSTDGRSVGWTSQNGRAVVVVAEGGTVTVNHKSIDVTKSEWILLAAIAFNRGKVRTRRMLLACLYPEAEKEADAKILDVMICKIRAKLEKAHPAAGECLRSVWGRGYAFGLPSRESSPVAGLDMPSSPRWVRKHKMKIVGLLRSGEINTKQVLAHYPDLSEDELLEWFGGYSEYGEKGLLATKVQECVL